MNPVKIRLLIHHAGLLNVLMMVLYKTVNKVLCFKIYNICCLTPESLNRKMRDYKCQYQHRLISNDELIKYIDDDELEWDQSSVDDVIKKGDQVFGLLDDETLIGYLCFSNKPTHFNGCLTTEFDDRYLYAYKGFTKKAYRGNRLYAEAMVVTVNEFYRQGYIGILSCIEASNFASMKAAEWIGFRTQGSLLLFRIFGKCTIIYSRSCLDFGLKLISENRPQDAPSTDKPSRVQFVG